MSDLLVGVLAVAVGLLFALRGYLTMRVIIPVWGAMAGFLLGAGIVGGLTDEGFFGTALGWVVGAVVAVAFGLLAYLYYEVSVVLSMGAVGYVLGSTVMIALGVQWTWLIVLAGLAAGTFLAFIAIVADLPMVLLTVLTATAGASITVGGLMLLVGHVDLDEIGEQVVTARLEESAWWWAVYAVVVVVGIVAQLRALAALQHSMREEWRASGGRELRA